VPSPVSARRFYCLHPRWQLTSSLFPMSSPAMIERIKCSDTAITTKPKERGETAKPIVAAARISGMSTWPFGLSSCRRVDVFISMSSYIDVFSSNTERARFQF
jgi:hypothetical protein